MGDELGNDLRSHGLNSWAAPRTAPTWAEPRHAAVSLRSPLMRDVRPYDDECDSLLTDSRRTDRFSSRPRVNSCVLSVLPLGAGNLCGLAGVFGTGPLLSGLAILVYAHVWARRSRTQP